MSRENVEVVRRFLEQLWDRGDMDAALAHVDANVELDWSRSRAPYAGIVRGREAARRWFESV
jgi:ketosteroid isomerase-like protein